MSDAKDTRDTAGHGGGIGDIGRQPIDPSSENAGNATPDVQPQDEDGVVGGLSVDEDVTPSGEDPDDTADDTLGTVV